MSGFDNEFFKYNSIMAADFQPGELYFSKSTQGHFSDRVAGSNTFKGAMSPA